MRKRVIVDENTGSETQLWAAFQRAFGDHSYDYVFLSEQHRGIPDVEILDKLMGPDAVLLTGDCVLHMRALERGYRSYTLNELITLDLDMIATQFLNHDDKQLPKNDDNESASSMA